uniref:Uncharacterized protein n=1 Tax=Streptomyces sp. NBC_01401 TaxID=2903854 RepID=A0AAU3GVS9_9ACTN
MNTNSTSQRRALVIVFIGVALAVTGSVLVFLTHETVWRYLLAGGGFTQFVGWVLHNSAQRGGERR